MEEEQSDDIGHQAERADDDDNLCVADLWRGDESSNSFQTDRHAQREQKHSIDKRAENLRALPSVRVGAGRRGRGELDCVQRDDEREDVTGFSLSYASQPGSTHLSMWNESATSASDPIMYPEIISYL